MLVAYVHGIGVRGAGLAHWAAACEVFLCGATTTVLAPPDASLLPPNERRRSSTLARWALDVATQATAQAELRALELATVFASSGGDYDVLEKICTSLTGPAHEVSPTLFHHSVHNAAAGYWCIATGNQQASTSIAAYDYTFAVGLVEAMTYAVVEQQPVLLVAYDLPPSRRLYPARPLEESFAAAMVLNPDAIASTDKELRVHLVPKQPDIAATRMTNAELETARLGNPAARALPLLAALVDAKSSIVNLEYSDDQLLQVEVSACRC